MTAPDQSVQNGTRLGQTITETIARSGGRTTGFDYMRVGLALSIILWHGIPVSYGPQVEIAYWRGPLGDAMHFVLPMFFALSGFLVAGSLDRCRTLISFFGLRVLRIVPALAVEVLVSALLFGPLLSSQTAASYFTDPRFAGYFLNILGDIHFVLPGMFETNPVKSLVNAQLWTIPFELQCYLTLGGLALTAALRKRAILLVLVVVAQSLWIWHALSIGDNGGSGGASGPVLVIAFLCGLLFHLYRDVIRLHPAIFLAILIAAIALSALPHGAYYLPLPCTYITVYLGLLNPRPIKLVSSGDYSYGLYLYSYPLQQAIAAYGPPTRHWWASAGLGVPAALLVAVVSWHYVERPALGLRRRIPALEARLARLAAPRHRSTASSRAALTAIVSLCGVGGALLFVNANSELACATVLCGFGVAVVRGRWGAGKEP
jgi:peptidoglycan/LPS O-acetylase OafA/YrhL